MLVLKIPSRFEIKLVWVDDFSMRGILYCAMLIATLM